MQPRRVIAMVTVALLGALAVSVFLGFGRLGALSSRSPENSATRALAPAQPVEVSTRAQIDQRLAELQDLAYENDSNSLSKILVELKNSNPEIRHAAVEAAVQFGSRDAIPNLQEAASQTTNREERARLLDAVEFLKLPSLTEVLSGKTNSAQPSPVPPAR